MKKKQVKHQKEFIPKKAQDISQEWRACMVYIYSPAMSCWIKQNYRETIKPNESCRAREILIATSGGYDYHEVILSPCLDAE